MTYRRWVNGCLSGLTILLSNLAIAPATKAESYYLTCKAYNETTQQTTIENCQVELRFAEFSDELVAADLYWRDGVVTKIQFLTTDFSLQDSNLVTRRFGTATIDDSNATYLRSRATRNPRSIGELCVRASTSRNRICISQD